MNGIIKSFTAAIAVAVLLAGNIAFAGQPAVAGQNVLKALDVARTPIDEIEEIAIGRRLTGELLGAAPLTDDPDLQHYVNRVGHGITAHSERPNLPWRFGVIDTKSVNAYSAPGGIVLVGRGLYEILENEAQLAAVLAHAIATVARRQHIEVMRRRAGHEAMTAVGASVLAARGPGAYINSVLTAGAARFASGIEHAAVYEADEAGLHLAARAGYNPYALVDVLHKLEIRRPGVSAFFSFETHPLPAERLQTLGAALTPLVSSLPPGVEPPIQAVSALCYFPCRPTRQFVPLPRIN